MAVVGKPNHALPVTPSDTSNLRVPSTHLSFTAGTAGLTPATVYIDTVGGETSVGITLLPGMYAIAATKVYATGTTALDIVAYWDS